jgi:hypothetical protein
MKNYSTVDAAHSTAYRTSKTALHFILLHVQWISDPIAQKLKYPFKKEYTTTVHPTALQWYKVYFNKNKCVVQQLNTVKPCLDSTPTRQ